MYLVNKLTINTAKSQALILSPKLRRTGPPISEQLCIVSAGVLVKIVDNAKYFEIKIDSKLNFKEHIKTLEGKLPARLACCPSLNIFFLVLLYSNCTNRLSIHRCYTE